MPKYLSCNSGTEVPESIFFVDTETSRIYHKGSTTNFTEKFRIA